MSEIVFLLEEESAKAMLQGLLPKILPSDIACRFIVFEGKQDLEKQMTKRMRGYRVPDALFVVMRDKDSEDCKAVKGRLLQKCSESGKSNFLVRVVCHELESWYLGDLSAVEAGLKITGLLRHQEKQPCTDPDAFAHPSHKLSSLAPSYQKVSGSRAIGQHLNPEQNSSYSFGVFVTGLRKILPHA